MTSSNCELQFRLAGQEAVLREELVGGPHRFAERPVVAAVVEEPVALALERNQLALIARLVHQPGYGHLADEACDGEIGSGAVRGDRGAEQAA